ncbi:MAG: class II aldolase/adducin family protein [Candidatus Omnitrophota bacterium]|jgi:ribulose-5-phosphate 4-epimerase/fuculose-1-phosphate aldolase
MIFAKERKLRKEMIEIGKRLYALRLVAASGGNLSARIDERNILVTATATELGNLKSDDIIRVNLDKETDLKNQQLTTEFPLHRMIYENLPARIVIHCHPALSNAYFAVYPDLKVLTFESKLHLGNIPVIEQDTPAVSKPDLVVAALNTNNLVVLKNHGVVSLGNTFQEAFNLVETLEEAVRTVATARLFKKEIVDDLDKELKASLKSQEAYEMFSTEHIQAIVDLANQDEFIAQKGRELDLTMEYAIKLDGTGKAHKFTFEKGEITKLEPGENAQFVASAPAEVWKMIFLGKLDPFVATMQGKMKLKGELGKLSRWYVPFSRLFELFKQVKIK